MYLYMYWVLTTNNTFHSSMKNKTSSDIQTKLVLLGTLFFFGGVVFIYEFDLADVLP